MIRRGGPRARWAALLFAALSACGDRGSTSGSGAPAATNTGAEASIDGGSASAAASPGASAAPGLATGAPRGVRASDKREPSADELFREEERIARGEAVDEPLRRPKLRISKDGVEVNGLRLEDAALSGSDAAIDPALERWLRLDREHVRMIVPGRPFEGRATIEIDPDVHDARALSAIATVNRAGFDAEVSSADVRFRTQALTVTDVDVAELSLQRGAGWQLRFLGRVPCRLPKRVRTAGTTDELARAVFESCEGLEGGCAGGLRVVPAGELAAMVAPLAAVLGALREHGSSVTILPTVGPSPALARCPGARDEAAPLVGDAAAKPTPAKSSSATEAKAAAGVLRFGQVTSDGPLGEADLRAALGALEKPLLGCAAETRASQPDLIGRLSVQGVALRDGRVAQLGWSSDLPSAALVDCALARMADLELPARPEKPTRFSAAMLFAPR